MITHKTIESDDNYLTWEMDEPLWLPHVKQKILVLLDSSFLSINLTTSLPPTDV